MKKLQKDFNYIAYFILTCGFAVGGYIVYQVRFEATAQFIVVLCMTGFYLLWSVIFHHYRNDLNFKIFFEYAIIAAIAIGAAALIYLK